MKLKSWDINNLSLHLPWRFLRSGLLLCCILFSTFASAQMRKNTAYQNYIEQYKDLAIEQMKRHQIPASITLAQGLFESGAGLSTLAKKSNNHFGIKCHNDWKGKRTYHDDDRKNDCFRVYPTVRDSYEDHSRFLHRPRYSRLFDLKITDYKGWARGLKACGYATLPTYAQKLIEVIELYELYKYDSGKYSSKNSKEEATVVWSHELKVVNGRDVVIAKEGDTWESLSRELKSHDIKISARKLRKYNESPTKYFFPEAGTNIFLQKKATKADKLKYSKDYWHRVQSGESMYSISQFYGVQMKSLYKRNYRPYDYTPQPGDLLKVR